MFTWICPKCGGEVPPAYDECPRCNPPKPRSAPAATAAEPPAAPPPPPPPVQAAPPPVPPTQPPPTPSIVDTAPPPPLPPPPNFGQPYPPPAYSTPPSAVGQVSYGAPAQPARTVSPTLVAIGAGLGIVALLAVLYLFVLPKRSDSDASATGSTAETAKLEKPGAGGAAVHPMAKHLEVSGVRIQEQSGGKVRIDFVVVNHSAADLPKLKMEVRVVAAGREYFVIPVDLPSIGPYESKDLSSSVRTDLKPYELPDWQMVQAKFTLQD